MKKAALIAILVFSKLVYGQENQQKVLPKFANLKMGSISDNLSVLDPQLTKLKFGSVSIKDGLISLSFFIGNDCNSEVAPCLRGMRAPIVKNFNKFKVASSTKENCTAIYTAEKNSTVEMQGQEKKFKESITVYDNSMCIIKKENSINANVVDEDSATSLVVYSLRETSPVRAKADVVMYSPNGFSVPLATQSEQ